MLVEIPCALAVQGIFIYSSGHAVTLAYPKQEIKTGSSCLLPVLLFKGRIY